MTHAMCISYYYLYCDKPSSQRPRHFYWHEKLLKVFLLSSHPTSRVDRWQYVDISFVDLIYIQRTLTDKKANMYACSCADRKWAKYLICVHGYYCEGLLFDNQTSFSVVIKHGSAACSILFEKQTNLVWYQCNNYVWDTMKKKVPSHPEHKSRLFFCPSPVSFFSHELVRVHVPTTRRAIIVVVRY